MPQLLRTQFKFAATGTAPGCARMFVRCTLRSWLLASLLEDAELIVSELVTNAVRVTGMTDPNATYADLANLAIIAVQVRVSGESLFIEVWDADTDQPHESPAGEQSGAEGGLAEGGRGLLIVRHLSKRCGVMTLASGGKVVWSELDAGPEIANVPQMDPRPLPRGWRQIMNAPGRQPPQHAQADLALYRNMTRRPAG